MVNEADATCQLIGPTASVCASKSVGVMNLVKMKCKLTAMAMARLASVTVSMGDETKGVFMVICLVSAEVRSCKKQKTSLQMKILSTPVSRFIPPTPGNIFRRV